LSPSPVRGTHAVRQLLDAILVVGPDMVLPRVLHDVVDGAVDVVVAHHGAIELGTGNGGTVYQLVNVGIADDQLESIRRQPPGRGVVGGRSYLRVPIQGRSGGLGHLYLTERYRAHELIEDRERIAVDLHDTVIQRLFAIGLSLQGTVKAISQPETAKRVATAVDDLDETIRQVRATMFTPQPPAVVDHRG
jgi:signal transduction histidine kinase